MNFLVQLLGALVRAAGWEPIRSESIWETCLWCGGHHPPERVELGGIDLVACPDRDPGSLFYVQR